MKSFIAILFLAMFMATNCASAPAPRRMGMSPAQKTILKKVLKAGVDFIKTCATAELASKIPAPLVKMGLNPAKIADGIAKLANKAIDHIVGRRRLNMITDAANKAKNAVKGAAGAVYNAAASAGKGLAAVAGPMQAAAKKLNALTGGALAKGIASVGCPALINAIKAGIMAQFAGLQVPACVTSWFTSKCQAGIAAAFKRARLLRRLSALRRDILNF